MKTANQIKSIYVTGAITRFAAVAALQAIGYGHEEAHAVIDQPAVSFELEARRDGWVTDAEKHPDEYVHHGVVHADGWWAPDWEAACKGFGQHRELPRPLLKTA